MFSVVIPTYNRCEILSMVLDAYLKQTHQNLIKEIIIIDDGSTDDTKSVIDRFFERFPPFNVIYLYQENSGPAEARNKGIQSSSGEILLLTGDDIVPHPEMIKEHFAKHKMYNLDNNICILGRTIWPEDMKVTPFMKHIQEMGLQFGYSIIPDQNDVPFTFFYTSNISLHRDFVLGGQLFDTDFPFAAWEDIEMAYRLKKRGLRIIYNSIALGYHYHDISYASFRGRQVKCGYAAGIFYTKHPELEEFLGINSSKKRPLSYKFYIKLIDIFCSLSDKHSAKSYPKLYDMAMSKYYLEGIDKWKSSSKMVKE